MDKKIALVKKYLLEHTISETQAAKLADLGQPKVNRLLNGTTKKVDAVALNKLMEALGIAVEGAPADEEVVEGDKKSPLEANLRRLVNQITDEALSTVSSPEEELDLMEDFMAFRRALREKKRGT